MPPTERDPEHDEDDAEGRVPIGEAAADEDERVPSGLPPGEHDDDPASQETG
jgi:hypothetical protein